MSDTAFLIVVALSVWFVICLIISGYMAVRDKYDGFVLPIFAAIGIWIISLSLMYIFFLTVLGFIEMGKWLVEMYV